MNTQLNMGIVPNVGLIMRFGEKIILQYVLNVKRK